MRTGILLLVVTILAELVGTTIMKLAGLRAWGLAALPCYVVCLICFNRAVAALDFSLVYAIWAGLGMSLSMVVGVLVFGEHLTLAKVCWTGVTFIGILGLTAANRG